MSTKRTSAKFHEARQSLPASLQPVYDQLVDEYAHFTVVHFGRGYVAYRVLASLVQQGWRPTESGGSA
jgi:hypothetical protein